MPYGEQFYPGQHKHRASRGATKAVRRSRHQSPTPPARVTPPRVTPLTTPTTAKVHRRTKAYKAQLRQQLREILANRELAQRDVASPVTEADQNAYDFQRATGQTYEPKSTGVEGLDEFIRKGQASGDLAKYPSTTDFGLLLASAPLPELGLLKGLEVVGKGLKAEQGASEARSLEEVLSRGGLRKYEGRTAADRAKAIPKRTVKKVKVKAKNAKATLSKEGGHIALGRAATGAGAVVATSPAIAGLTGELTARQAKALVDDPGKTLKTTAGAALGVPAAAAGAAASVGTTASRAFRKEVLGEDIPWSDVVAPTKNLAEQQKAYYETLAAIAGPDEKKAIELVQNETGIVPAISEGLTAFGIGKGLAGPARELAPHTSRKVKRLTKVAETADTPRDRRLAKEDLERVRPEPSRQRRANRKREAERAAVVGEKDQGQFARETRAPRKLRVLPGKSLVTDVAALHRRKLNDHVSEGDVVQFLGRQGLTAETRDVIGKVRAIRDQLREPSRELDPDTLATRPVIDAILEHPDVLSRPEIRNVLDQFADLQRGRSVERHTEETGKRQSTPSPADEVVRLRSIAQAEGIPMPHEQIPHELRGVTKVKPKTGQDAAKAIRDEADKFAARAKRLRTQAAEQRKTGNKERADTLEHQAAESEAQVTKLRKPIDLFREADILDGAATRIEQGKPRPNEEHMDPAELRAHAEYARKEGQEAQAALAEEFTGRVQDVIKREGYREPIYFRESDAADRGESLTDYPTATNARKEKHRLGVLAQEGRIDESAITLIENTRRARASFSERERARGFIEDQALSIDGRRIFTGSERRKLQREGQIPSGYRDVPVSEFAGAIQRDPKLRAEVEARRKELEALDEGGSHKLYISVPESAIKEYRAQAERSSRVVRGLRAVSRIQTALMLATSPSWFAFQLVATPLTVAARHWNPFAWGRAAVSGIRMWRRASEQTRTDFRAHFGGNPADFLDIGENVRGISPDTLRSMSDALSFAFKSPVGRMVHAIGSNLRKGGPLMSANRKYEAAWRTFEALLEMDRESGLTLSGKPRAVARVKKFAKGTAGLSDTVYRHMEQLKGLKPEERVDWYTRHPKEMRELELSVDDAFGNWNALTSAEKKLSSVVVFYPFLRFSLKWMFVNFPKHNPFKMALYLNLAQSNNQEYRRLIGGAPSFFADYGNVIVYNGEHGEPTAINLSRAAPGSNAVLEGVGGDDFNLSTVLRPLQPAINTTAMALEHKDSFGRDSDNSTGELLAKGGLSLSPLTRPLAAKVGADPSDISLLFKYIEGRDGGLSDSLVPQLVTDIGDQAVAQRLSSLLDKAADKPSDSEVAAARGQKELAALSKRRAAAQKAQAQIDKLLRKYDVETKQQQKRDSDRVGKNFGEYLNGNDSQSGPSAYDQVFGSQGSSRRRHVSQGTAGAFQEVFGG